MEYFDSVGEREQAQLYRDKIHMLFVKPIVIQEYLLMTNKK